MTIDNWLITGDTHGTYGRFVSLPEQYAPDRTGIFILGDAGVNYFLGEEDTRLYNALNNLGYTFYCVKGNHEEDPRNISTLVEAFDMNVAGQVYYNPDYPRVRFLKDGIRYYLAGIGGDFICFGGAYSVDKHWRLMNGHQWFADEQLSPEDQDRILWSSKGQKYKYVFSHTCPYSWRPIENFLPGIDQSTVDDRTERWLEDIYQSIEFEQWWMGHWHTFKGINDQKGKGRIIYQTVHDLATGEVIQWG